jgi:hypothetical protein
VVAKSDYYPPPKPKNPKRNLIIWHGPKQWRARDGVGWQSDGFAFEEGVVYLVDDEVNEYTKRRRGFSQVKDIRLDEIVRFKHEKNTMGERQSVTPNGLRSGNKKRGK